MSDEFVPPQRFANIRGKISLFLVAAVAGMIGIVLLVAYKQGVFVRHTPINFYAADAFGINKGMAVKLFGLPIGDVRELEITEHGVKVQLSIVSDYLPRLTKGAQARLLREGYIGAANIQIVPAKNSDDAGGPLSANDTIEFIPSRGITEIVEDLRNQFTPVLGEMRRMFNDAKSPDGGLRKAADSIGTVLERLPATQEEARQFLRDADRTVLALGRDAGATLESTARIGAQIDAQLPAIAGKLSTTLDSLTDAASQLRDAAKKNGDALHGVLAQAPGILSEGENLVREGRDMVGGARNTWPFSNMVEPRTMRALPMDSFESAGDRGAAAATR